MVGGFSSCSLLLIIGDWGELIGTNIPFVCIELCGIGLDRFFSAWRGFLSIGLYGSSIRRFFSQGFQIVQADCKVLAYHVVDADEDAEYLGKVRVRP